MRELHTYGRHVPVHEHHAGAAQHRGFGWQLIEEAQHIAKEEWGLKRIAVIAGVGVREYYQKLGFSPYGREYFLSKEVAFPSPFVFSSSARARTPSPHVVTKSAT